MAHRERHRSERIGWLRAAVLGANDGIVSTASLVVGVAAAEAARQDVLVAGVAGLVAGALSMAAGEYVSVSSQADTEQADLTRERHELATEPQAEEDELTGIYVRRGLGTGARSNGGAATDGQGRAGRARARRARPDRRTRRAAVCRRLSRRRQRSPSARECPLRRSSSHRRPRSCWPSSWCRCCAWSHSAPPPPESAEHPCWSARRASRSGACWRWPQRPQSEGYSARPSDSRVTRPMGERTSF